MEIAHQFHQRWNLPNCGGAIDGKHVRITPPANSGSFYYNYKGFFSVILMAIVNANYEFIFVDVGKNGRVSDGGALEQTTFHARLRQGKLNLPTTSQTHCGLNFVFAADEAFALMPNVLRPFPMKSLTPERRIFNYRLSRARRVVENAFGILSNKFRIFHTSINLRHDKLCKVVMTCCILHNYLRRHAAQLRQSTDRTDHVEFPEESERWISLSNVVHRNQSEEAKANRNSYVEYVNGIGAVPWQNYHYVLGNVRTFIKASKGWAGSFSVSRKV